MMLISILLPTRNRLEYLRHAVESVLRQDDPDWELVISDNDSEEDIKGFVVGLADTRIRYVRTASFVPVTDNWNNALQHSHGEYVVMLGDDDALMSGYIREIRAALKKYTDPDFIYTSAFLFAYPGAMPGYPDGYLQDYGYSSFLKGARQAFWLSRQTAFHLVDQFLHFHTEYGYNMQFFCISRRMINALNVYGPFFQSPFPDYYAANAMMLKANRILILPIPLVTIGISPKSFGFYYFNGKEDQGAEFLKDLPESLMAESLKKILLPGSHLFTSWLFSAETLCARFGLEFPIRTNIQQYRYLQIQNVYRNRSANRGMLGRLWKKLCWRERMTIVLPMMVTDCIRKILPVTIRRVLYKFRHKQAQSGEVLPVVRSGYKTIADVFIQIDPNVGISSGTPKTTKGEHVNDS